ncbi:NAD-dependent epimerase/dehydratase family protein [Actinocorallia sp. API 0066]|uniref:NAD-dependent epimerase/dehydratase family protein n=1 Tax=Actinocorallia sp. API 0066 TaxID=2896846 RepID=UPI001E5316C1|nr:NAD-dependent epimerase/dehydratase family protein [Actinocorallia sp. API 0066]MCD0452247.1 NAD-dependent epimerase/dehydratase family protein [Actinocorallia sp. API 0066]
MSSPRASSAARVVLVTGVSRFLGARVANTLQADPGIDRVIGVDTVPPAHPLGRTEFVRVDIRTSGIAKVIEAAEVDTVVHLNLVTSPSGQRSAMKEINVIGAMQLLAACQRSPHTRKLVVRSSAAVYGSSPRDPAVFTEDTEPVEPPASGYAKDAAEVEGYVRGLQRRRSDLVVSVLRFVNFLGAGVDSPLTRVFRMPAVPTVLGFDPRLQFLHEDDGVEVLRRMTVEDHPGVFNVAGDGVLLLSQCLRRAGRVSVPLPAPAYALVGDTGRRIGTLPGFSAELQRWLTYGRVVDTARLASALSWRPKYDTAAAFAEFAQAHGLGNEIPLALFDTLTAGLPVDGSGTR